MRLLLSPLLWITLFSATTYGQTLFSNGALMTINPGGTVFVNGGVELSAASTLANQGQLTITKNSTFSAPGNFTIGTSSNVGGNGLYFVQQDWINNGNFISGSSTVTLFGNTQQFITSTNAIVTEFNNLILTGTGVGTNRKKTLQLVNAQTGANGTLTLNDRELETQTNTFYVINNSPAAVAYNAAPGAEGFVSSLSPGNLSRLTNAASSYIFPTGSSAGTLRFRPVELTPQSNVASQYVVRFNNVDASTQAFDRNETDGTFCAANPIYYHSIDRLVGTAPTDVKLFYIVAADGDWSGMAHWKNASLDWNDMSTTNAATAGIFTTRSRAAWNFTAPGHPYILTNVRPEAPVVNCPTLCQNSTGNVFTLTGTTPTYQWTFPTNGTITSGQGTTSVTANWTTGAGQVSAIAVDANGCSSLPGTCTPTISPNPNVQFTYTEDGNTFNFDDQTTGAVTWDWTFGDGGTSAISDPSHTYAAIDAYTVSLEVTNATGCIGMATQLVEIFQEIIIPNVITTNNDGVNDVFEIKTVGAKSYDLVIVNRWGSTVFTTDDPTISWDGKTDGKPVDDGVYFYILNVESSTKEYKFQGNVTVVHN